MGFHQNGAENYFRFRFSLHFWIPPLRCDRKRHKYRWGMRTTFWDISLQISTHLKIMQMSYVHSGIKIFMSFCRHTCLLPSRRKLVIFVENWNIERYLSLVPLRKKYPKNAVFPQNGADNYFQFRFSLHFEFHVLELIENDINIDWCSWQFFEILGGQSWKI